MTTIPQVTELSFEQIKNNLKSYYKRDGSPFKDWDFEASGLNYLVDILAYNTHYNAINAHVSMNETFLDSAQVRSNVVSRAGSLGYTPRSRTSARAVVDVFFTRDSESTATSLTLPKGTKFSTVISGDTYIFTTLNSYQTLYVDGGFTFQNVELVQGDPKVITAVVDSSNPRQIFQINDEKIDTTTLNVLVYDSSTSGTAITYVSHKNFSTLDSTTTAYFLSESFEGKYQIEFGDDIIGKKLSNLNIVEISYVSSAGPASNGARDFRFISSGVGEFESEIDNGAETFTVSSPAAGGDERESIEEIRITSPIAYIAQDRAVTETDYEALIRENVAGLDAVAIWGGQYNEPPVYGKVFISSKPNDSDYLTEEQKNSILDLVNRKNILTVTPEIVDPDYTYLYFDVFFRYDSSATPLSQAQMESVVRDQIEVYNSEQLVNFDRIFRYSNFLTNIDNSDPAVLSSLARLYVYKEFGILETNRLPSEINFKMAFHGTVKQPESIIATNSWLFNNQYLYLGDEPDPNSNTLRRVYAYQLSTDRQTRLKVFPDVGSLDIATGKLELDALPTDGDVIIRIQAVPDSNDIISVQNQVLAIDVPRTSITGSDDTSPSELEIGNSQFKTFPTFNDA